MREGDVVYLVHDTLPTPLAPRYGYLWLVEWGGHLTGISQRLYVNVKSIATGKRIMGLSAQRFRKVQDHEAG